MEASITMTGWVGGAVDHRVHPNLTVATFRLACTPRIFKQGNWTDDPTTWITVNCFRALADNVALSLHKGDPVMVTGRLRTQVWQHKEDGTDRERLTLEAVSVGHDLSRGTASFARSVRPAVSLPSPSELPTDPWASGERGSADAGAEDCDDLDEDRIGADMIDEVTGEVRELEHAAA